MIIKPLMKIIEGKIGDILTAVEEAGLDAECLQISLSYDDDDGEIRFGNAIPALCEKVEREKGCEYCNSRFGIATHHTNEAGLQAGTKRNAKYCPNCGRRLEVKQDG